jgi:hypothetical protein
VRTSAQRQVDELNKQKESVAAHLSQISQLLGGQMNLADALKPSPAVQAPPAKAVTAPPTGNGSPAQKATVAAPVRPSAPGGQHAAPARPDAPTQAAPTKQSASAKADNADEQEWWTE